LNLNKSNSRNVVDSIIVWGTTNNSSWARDINIEGTYPLLLNDDGTPELTYYLVSANILREITGE
ncbi:MAG: endo-1,4-beta-xylanase, partial [Anaerolineales bacterium]|nr:endo-1,4-beta-xylanase [Anaerolineales bacterium]